MNNFGDKGLNYALAEVKQLHYRTCFRPINMNKLTSQEHKWAMESLIFITEKRDGIIKERACANGIIHQDCIKKEEV